MVQNFDNLLQTKKNYKQRRLNITFLLYLESIYSLQYISQLYSLIQEAFSQLSAQESFKQTSITNFLLPSPRKAVNNFALLAFALNQQRQL